ncbi:homocysteine S-methyltransferase [Limosilactobacillus reuteri]|uniref:homocysteine S-methyltransferase n=1 Tax=Limosilactobacillus reuteri TaxID=1598 RepID=UPI001E4CDAEA|nr:homocysteine S-methyltransferase [Limosilactobacillus reuteri]MCC4422720.1 homocysteine S-methyltransferase [Limosilactobacillus reuteri]
MTVQEIIDRSKRGQVTILDGAMGTEIEKLNVISNQRLWATDAVIQHPSLIRDLHEKYLYAGAQIIETATYQANPYILAKEGIDGHQIINQAVEIAHQAVNNYISETNSKEYPSIGGSIGPYGCALNNGSEYTGNYSLTYTEYQNYHKAQIALLAGKVDFLAIETFPKFEEIQAIIELLEEHFPNEQCWIALSLNKQGNLNDGTLLEKVINYLNQHSSVFAIGANCMDIRITNNIIKRMRKYTKKPLVVYPNNGDYYSSKLCKWIPNSTIPPFSELALQWFSSGAQIIGGCCRVTPTNIRQFSDAIHKNI